MQDGDVFLNLCFGDLWLVDGSSFIKINDGYSINIGEACGFVKVGHVNISDIEVGEFLRKPLNCI